MGDALFNLIWLIVIFIWLFLTLFKKKPAPLPKEERPQAPEEKIEPQDLWEALGFPFPPQPEKPQLKIKPQLEKIEVLAEPKVEKAPPIEKKEEVVKELEQELILSQDKLQEGIILSIILGPPNALTLRRSGEIGRHARLKI